MPWHPEELLEEGTSLKDRFGRERTSAKDDFTMVVDHVAGTEEAASEMQDVAKGSVEKTILEEKGAPALLIVLPAFATPHINASTKHTNVHNNDMLLSDLVGPEPL